MTYDRLMLYLIYVNPRIIPLFTCTQIQRYTHTPTFKYAHFKTNFANMICRDFTKCNSCKVCKFHQVGW